jgi:hypothetical protein
MCGMSLGLIVRHDRRRQLHPSRVEFVPADGRAIIYHLRPAKERALVADLW